MQCRIPYTAMDHIIIEKVKELFDKLYQRRVLIRLVGVRFSHLIQGSYQFNLFDDMSEKIMLYNAMDNIRNQFGEDLIKRASSSDIRHRSHFNPFNGKTNLLNPADE